MTGKKRFGLHSRLPIDEPRDRRRARSFDDFADSAMLAARGLAICAGMAYMPR